MNKILSLALKKAVSEYNPEIKEVNRDDRPDLFSLNNETELFQNDKGIIIKIDRSRDSNLTDFGKATLKDRYLGLMNLSGFVVKCDTYLMTTYMRKEFITTATISGSCLLHLFYLMVELRGLPISCFLNEVQIV